MHDGKIQGRTVDTGNPTVVEYIRQNTDDHGERDMAKNFPLFVDVSNKKMIVYGAGKIASRRVETLLAFAPSLTVIAPEASDRIRRAAEQHLLYHRTERYIPGSIPKDTFLVLAATDDQAVNEAIWQECRKKQILVNVCSNREHCDFQFPGIASRGNLVIGINAGGGNHHLAKAWTDKIRKEVMKDGFDDETEKTSDVSKA